MQRPPPGITAARVLAFGASITVTSVAVRGCGSLADLGPRDVPLRPPDWVFGVVWPVLYATTGVAWAVGRERADAPLAALSALCCAWLVAYVCLRWPRVAALLLLATAALAAAAAVALGGTAGALLAPLAAWTAFAAYLNAYDASRR